MRPRTILAVVMTGTELAGTALSALLLAQSELAATVLDLLARAPDVADAARSALGTLLACELPSSGLCLLVL